ncbi:unnamed protein product [Lota lota]
MPQTPLISTHLFLDTKKKKKKKTPQPSCHQLFGWPCAQVNKTILTQMKSMEQYKLGTVTADLIEATHTSIGGQVQKLNFTLLEAAMDMGCRVGGSSMSDYWLSLLDNPTNYCNLQNVIKGSGLINAPGYTEYTNEWECLRYGLASCKV